MARGRFINRSIATDEKVAKLSSEYGPWAVVFHHRVIAFLDKNGNIRADEYFLKATIFPRDPTVQPAHCLTFVAGLTACGLAIAYQSADGMPFLHFPAFTKNQPNFRPEKERPEYPEYDTSLQVELNQQVVYGQSIGGLQEGKPPPVPAKNTPLSVSESVSVSVRDTHRAHAHEAPVFDLVSETVADYNHLKPESWIECKVPNIWTREQIESQIPANNDEWDLLKIMARLKEGFLADKIHGIDYLFDSDRKKGRLNWKRILGGEFDHHKPKRNSKLAPKAGHLGAGGESEAKF